MKLMEVEAALGVEDVSRLVQLTAGFKVDDLDRLFSQALQSSICADGLTEVLFLSHFEPFLICN